LAKTRISIDISLRSSEPSASLAKAQHNQWVRFESAASGSVSHRRQHEWQLQHHYMQIEGMSELATPMINQQALAITPQAN
jgi:hypothetical protein